MVLAGEAGIGKTTVCMALASWAESQDIAVGWGVTGEWEGASPLWPWFEALSGIDADQQVIPADDDELQPADKAKRFQGVARWLTEQCQIRPVLVVIEDLHAAGRTASELFAYLSRRPLPPGLTVVATARPGHSIIDGLPCTRITMDGLGPDALGELATDIGRPVDVSAAEALARRTGGNPLFAQRLLEAGFTGSERDAGLPTDIAALIGSQLAQAPAEARPLLDALAVVGTTTVDVLQQMVAEPDAATVTRQLANSLVQVDRDQVAFRHGLLRETAYSLLPADQRFALHARAAEVLEPHAGPIAVAHHLSRAAATDRTGAGAQAARRAAEITRSSGALTEAADHQLLAVTILRDHGPSVELAEATLGLVTVLAELGRVAEAEALVGDIVESGVALPAKLRRDVVRGYGRLRWREEPNPSVLDATALVNLADQWLADSDDPDDVVAFHTARLHAAEIRGFTEDDLADAEAAVAAAERTDDPVLAAEALVARRRALMVFPERIDDKRVAAEAGLDLATSSRDAELASRARRLALCDAMAAGDRERALMLLPTDEITVAGREHQALTLASIAALEGRYDDADALLDAASKELQYLGLEAPTLDFVRIVHNWDLGRLESALAEFEPLLPLVADPALRAAVALSKAIDGNDAVAATLVDEALEQLTSGTPSLLWTVSMTLAAETAAAIDHPAVEQIHTMLVPFSGQCGLPPMATVPWVGAIDRILGLLCLRMGRIDEAIERLEASLTTHARMRAEPWVARSHAALAVARDATGDNPAAVEHRRRAVEIVERIGMSADVLVTGDLAPSQPSIAAPTTTGTTDRAGVFQREGAVWRVGLGSRQVMVNHVQGMAYLERLLSTPDADWHVLDLYSVPGAAPLEGAADTVIDDAARRAYQQRHQDLIAELEAATADADLGAVDRCQRELDALEQELLTAFGMGGRARTMADPTEKARVNVRRALTRALDRIDDQLPELAEHLRRSLETGRFCCYAPDPGAPVAWE